MGMCVDVEWTEPNLQQWFEGQAHGSVDDPDLPKFHWDQAWRSCNRRIELSEFREKIQHRVIVIFYIA